MENFSKWPVRPYRSCTGQVWYVHWFHLERCVLVQTAELYSFGKYVNWNLILSIVGLYLFSYGELFKVTCAAVQELYRSSLICTLIPILKAVFWSKQQSCTVLASILTGIWIFSLEGLCYIAMKNSSKSPVQPYRSCTGQLWYVHWFPSWKVCFGSNSRAVQLWEVCELEFDFINCGPLFI